MIPSTILRSVLVATLSMTAMPAAAGTDWRTDADRAMEAFRWQDAERIYREQIARDPQDADAWRSLARVLSWSDRLAESRIAYQTAARLDTDSPSALLGIASTLQRDRAFEEAQKLYAEAATRWPGDEDVQEAVRGFTRERRPRAQLSHEDDLSFRNSLLGLSLPLGGRHQVLLEREEEERPRSNTRTDNKLGYTYHFGLNHSFDVRARMSSYEYLGPTTDFAAIDEFEEYRLTYRRPITSAHQITLRYSYRPTRLAASGGEFDSHKYEASLRSQWTPRVATTVGTGSLTDLASGASSPTQLDDNQLVRIGIDVRATTRFSVSASYITNPDLDNSVDATTLLQTSLDVADSYSVVTRLRSDDYRSGEDQRSVFVGFRYFAGAHIWAELGVKHVERGARNGLYPAGTVVYRF
jgi:tetratricopeptide (TPR) repeat protein